MATKKKAAAKKKAAKKTTRKKTTPSVPPAEVETVEQAAPVTKPAKGKKKPAALTLEQKVDAIIAALVPAGIHVFPPANAE